MKEIFDIINFININGSINNENNIDVKFKLESSIPMEGNQPSKYKNNIFKKNFKTK